MGEEGSSRALLLSVTMESTNYSVFLRYEASRYLLEVNPWRILWWDVIAHHDCTTCKVVDFRKDWK